jgi:hypothetical protein
MKRYIYTLLLCSVRVLIYGLNNSRRLCAGVIGTGMSVVTVIKISCNIALMGTSRFQCLFMNRP